MMALRTLADRTLATGRRAAAAAVVAAAAAGSRATALQALTAVRTETLAVRMGSSAVRMVTVRLAGHRETLLAVRMGSLADRTEALGQTAPTML